MLVRMDLTGLHLVTAQVVPVSESDIETARRDLGTEFPPGYSDFVQRYGPGAVGDFVRVYIPEAVIRMTRDWRARVTEYWFWDTSATSQEPATFQSDGVLLADTFNGDEVCFIAGAPELCYLLPRDADEAIPIAGGLEEVIDRLLELGSIDNSPSVIFESWVDRAHLRYSRSGEDAFPSAKTDLLALGLHDLVQEEDKFLELLIPSIGGRLVIQGFHDLVATLSHDANAPEPVIEQITNALEANRLARSPG